VSLPSGVSGLITPSVACASPAACVSAVTYVDSDQVSHGVLVWGHGSSWTTYPVPLPGNADPGQPALLYSVACASPSACVAVGRYTTKAGYSEGMLVSGYGSTWKAVQVPVPANGTAGTGNPVAVACVPGGKCLAVGGYSESSGSGALVLWGFGSKWATSEPPAPPNLLAGTGIELSVAACAPDGACAAMGGYADTSRQTQDTLVSGHGSSWTAAEPRIPAGDGALTADYPGQVACTSAGHCVAVIVYANAAGTDRGTLASGYGKTWKMAKLALPSNGQAGSATPFTVACAASGQCLAVGEYSVAGVTHGLLEYGQGLSWAPAQAMLPANANPAASAYLEWVSCAPNGLCAATGAYTDTYGNEDNVVLSGTWPSLTPAQPPAPFASPEDIDSVSCTSSSTQADCAIAGGGRYASTDALLWGPS
jgi:hypothetical protein